MGERERVDARNSLEGFVFHTKSTLNGAEHGGADGGQRVTDQLTDDEKESVERALEQTNDWLDDNQNAEREELEEKLQELRGIVQPVFKLAYERAGLKEPGGHFDRGWGMGEAPPDQEVKSGWKCARRDVVVGHL